MEQKRTISEVADVLAKDWRVADALRRWTIVRLYAPELGDAYNKQLMKALEQVLQQLGSK